MKKIYALGPQGTNGHEAARMAADMLRLKHPNEPTEVSFLSQNAEVLELAAREGCFGVVPIENSSAGLVSEVVKFWLHRIDAAVPLYVIGEVLLPVEHHLLVHPDIRDVKDLVGVISHPQALSQCAKKLDNLGLQIRMPSSSTAGAAVEVATNSANRQIGALASRLAGEINGLHLIKSHLEDFPGNATRFHLVGPYAMRPTGNDRTAVIFLVPDRPRSLLNMLGCIGAEEVNMSSIHSIPLGFPGEYAFYSEFSCHAQDKRGTRILKSMKAFSDRVIILGSYSRGPGLKKGV